MGTGIIRVSTEKLSERVPKNGRIRMSTEIWYNLGECLEKVESVRVPKNCLDEYRKIVESGLVPKNVESVQVPKNCSDEYRKMVESGLVPENVRIRASIGKR